MTSKMGSRRSQPQHTQGVFGYIIDPCDGQEPGGPPLLDNNEAGILQTFFDNPSSLDPGFMSMQTANQASSGGPLAFNDSNFGWTVEHSHLPAHAAGAGHHASTPVQADESYHSNNQGMQLHLRGHAAPGANLPNDVYAAARLLQNTQDSQEQYHYPVMSRASAVNYEFPADAPVQRTEQSDNNSNIGYADVQNSVNDAATREKPLRFGSDEHFRASTYQAPTPSDPNKTLRESLQTFWKVLPPQDGDQPVGQPATARSTKKQKARSKTPEVESDESSDESESAGHQGKSPRKKKARGGEDGASVTKGAKRRQSTSQSKPKKASTTSSSKTSSKEPPSAVKGHRENLTEEQKRSNHIQSEQKRRNLIKQGFEDLNRMVPELRSGGLSKSNMLTEATKFLRQLRDDNDTLRTALSNSQ